MSSRAMLSGSRKQSVAAGNGSLMSVMPPWATPRASRCWTQLSRSDRCATPDGEVVETGAVLGEALALVGVVLVEAQEDRRAGDRHDHGVAGALVVRLDEGALEAEHLAVPGLAGVGVAHREAHVVVPRDARDARLVAHGYAPLVECNCVIAF